MSRKPYIGGRGWQSKGFHEFCMNFQGAPMHLGIGSDRAVLILSLHMYMIRLGHIYGFK